MMRRALLVGINAYDNMPNLTWCIDDVDALQPLLAFHEDRTPNFACKVLLGSQSTAQALLATRPERVTFTMLRTALEELFAFEDKVLFYFSGHGYAKEQGAYLVTQDGTSTLPGIALHELLDMANASRAREVLLLIDSCHSGALGEPDQNGKLAKAYLRPGVTLLAASRSDQYALEKDGRGLFTSLVIGALKGGASDVRGQISEAAIYAYVEQALGPWDQRPIYKSNATHLSPVRQCLPDIEDDELRRLPQFFAQANAQYFLDPSYEFVRSEALPEHVGIFKLFKRYQVARLLRPTLDNDLYFAAIHSHPVELTPIGQFYWQLAKNGLLGRQSSPKQRRRAPMPDAESVAKLFHETYERLAPTFGYETREATRVSWESVPERNKRLMIATTAELLAMLFPVEEQDATERI
ncbi:MAG: caspase family protein [Ktedonobacteraceae bacterium]